MIGDMGDAKRFLVEDVLVYSGLVVVNLAWDFLVNLAVACHLHINAHEPQGHVYSIGTIQIMVLAFCAIQIIRKLNDLRYYQ